MNICMLLDGGIAYDARVQKTIQSLAKNADVYLFCLADHSSLNLGEHVHIIPIDRKKNIKTKVIKNTFFWREFLYYIKVVEKTGVKFDIIYANDFPTLLPAYRLSKYYNASLIYDSHEIYLGTLNQFYSDNLFFLKRWILIIIISFIRVFGFFVEKQLVKQVDYFITTSVSFLDYFKIKYPIRNSLVVMNCPPTKELTKPINLKKQLNIPENSPLFVFQGVLNKGRAINELLAAMRLVNINIHLVIIGKGMLKNSIIDFIKKNKIKNIHFLDFVDLDKLPNYTRAADVGINLQAPVNISKKLASANKLFEYMHAEIPVLASNVPENSRILDETKIGLLTENNPQEIAQKIEILAFQDNSSYIRNCKIAKQKYNWKNQEKELMQIFKEHE